MSEFELIDWIRARVPTTRGERVVLGIGDDCAALRFTPGREVVVTTDMLMDGRHFHADQSEEVLRKIGRKALGVNLSDIAAMAALPVAAVVAVALPRRLGVLDSAAVAERLHPGLREMAERHGVALVGGDTNAWDGPLVISVTVLGEATARGLALRSGARVGDAIVVTGPLGGSLRGRHLEPVPRVREALAIHQRVQIHSMIDISDGLAADLGHVLDESGGLGADLRADAIPIHVDATLLSKEDGRSALEHALHDGEDFELCFTMDARELGLLRAAGLAELQLHEIGEVTAEPGLKLQHGDGRVELIEPRGFDHFHAGGGAA